MDAKDILIDIRRIVRSINLESKRVQKDFGISIPQLLCLGHIERSAEKRCTHKELMQLLSLNSSTVTGIVNRLEKKGFLKRLPKAGDRRVTLIGITKSGSKIVKKSPDALHDQLTKKLKSLPTATQMKIKDALTIIVRAMNIDSMEASPVLTVNEPIEPSSSQSDIKG